VWDWVIIVGCYAFAAVFLRLIGGFSSAADAIASWGKSSSVRRLSRSGQSPANFARSRLSRR
jgi:hypothetical protein